MARLINSFGYAFRGIDEFFKSQPNARIHLAGAIAAIILGFVFTINRYEWIAIVLVIGLVLAAEVINTAIENLCDKISKEIDPDIARIKDMSAGAVLITALAALITGLIIFIPKIF